MFNKYKKKILLILTLVFLFNFSFGYKRAEASVIAAAGIGLGVVLLAAAGVAITSPQMAQDLGGRLWNGLKEVVEVPKKIGDFFKVQVTGAMLEFTAKWLNKEDSIPKEPVETVVNSTELPNELTYHGSGTHLNINFSDSFSGVRTLKFMFDDTYKEFAIKLGASAGDFNKISFISMTDSNWTSLYAYTFLNGAQTGMYAIDSLRNPYGMKTIDLKDILVDGVSIKTKSFTTDYKNTIPYTPEVSSGASEEKLTTSLPVGSTVTYPQDLTTNFPATQDKPISSVTDIPNVKVDTNVTDVPGTETGVIEGTLTNIAELLQSLVNAITNIFVPPAEDLVPIDLSPLYVGITDKFPFSVPFDLIKTFQNMSDSSKAPRFEVKFPEKYFGSYTFVIDFEQFNDFILILRYFLLLSFIIFLILQTRNIIGG